MREREQLQSNSVRSVQVGTDLVDHDEYMVNNKRKIKQSDEISTNNIKSRGNPLYNTLNNSKCTI